MDKIYLVKTKNREIGYDIFLDSRKGVIVDISKCLCNKNLMLFDVQSLCNNVTELKKKNNNYYIGNTKFLNTKETLKYINEAFTEMDNSILNGKTYLCIDYIGNYQERYKAYEKLLKVINLKKYKICGIPVEQYIDGNWNKKDEKKYRTNIMIPVEKYEQI